MSEISYHVYPSGGEALRTMYGWINGAPGSAAVDGARVGLGNLGNSFAESDAHLQQLARDLGTVWESRAADAVGTSLHETARFAGAGGTGTGIGSGTVDTYGRSFEALRPAVTWQDPGSWDWWEMGIDVYDAALDQTPMGGLLDVQSDYMATVEENRTLEAQARHALVAHESVVRDAVSAFGRPGEGTVAEPATLGPAGASGLGGAPGPGGGTGSWGSGGATGPGAPGTAGSAVPVGVGPPGAGGAGPAGVGGGPAGPGNTGVPWSAPVPARTATPAAPAALGVPTGSARDAAVPGPGHGSPVWGPSGTGSPGAGPPGTGPMGAGPIGAGPGGAGPGGAGRPGFGPPGTTGHPITTRHAPDAGDRIASGSGGRPGWTGSGSPGSSGWGGSGGGADGRAAGHGGRPGPPVTTGGTYAAPGAAPRGAGHGPGYLPMMGGAAGGSGPSEHRRRYWVPTDELFDVPLPPHTEPVIGGESDR